ncbi:MAG: 23S rRNA (guanosine(2251)-2'-O)-methyltransferase RlmB [Oscillospiraceae bacterium]|nr:23S rRNA (guanosine(2251)-2'-O)-methyltransferase RlmB [Oscillospiraceae bacterium]
MNDKGFIIGRNPVIEALKAGRSLDTVYIAGGGSSSGGSLPLIRKLSTERGIPIKQVSGEKLDFMAGGASHQGVIASGCCAEYVEISVLLENAEKKNRPAFIIICAGLEDPHNLGAVIRTAEAAGADGIIIPKRRSASLNQTVYKTSAGAAALLPAARVANIVAAIDELKSKGVWVYGADISGGDYTKADLTGHIALVIGSESAGLGRLIKEKCDCLLKLPMNGSINSLNASVAAGVLMYEVLRQRSE